MNDNSCKKNNFKADKIILIGGGGHAAAGTCQVANDKADGMLQMLVRRINIDG